MSYLGLSDPLGPGCCWVRTSEGWRHRQDDPGFFSPSAVEGDAAAGVNRPRSTDQRVGVAPVGDNVERFQGSDESNQLNIWIPHMGQIQGTGKLRKTTNSLSEAFRKLEVFEASVHLNGFTYCVELFEILLCKCFLNLSGTTQKEIFRIIQCMADKAIQTETCVAPMKRLLKVAQKELQNKQRAIIGSKVLWKNNMDNVQNMITRLNNFKYSEREEDELPCLLDLPKECLRNIIYRLSDHRDVANLRATCSYMQELCYDLFVWRKLSYTHFTDKQLYPYVNELEYFDTDWEDVFRQCLQKHKKLKKIYGDEIVICGLCRNIFWKNIGHPCHHNEELPFSSHLSPAEFVQLFSI